MTDPTEEDLEVVASAADKVERRLLHVTVEDRLDEVMRERLKELFGVIV